MSKLCKKCQTQKPLSEFYAKKTGRGGLSSQCKTCCAAINADYRSKNGEKIAARISAWHEQNPDKKREYHRKNYTTVESRARCLWRAARKRKPEGFTLTLDHVTRGVQRGYCAVTGIAFDLSVNENGKKSRSFNAFAPSLDKTNAAGSYSDENSRVVIWQYNLMKGELSDAEVLELCRAVVARVAA